MPIYRDWDNDSNIRAFEIGPDRIEVTFKPDRIEVTFKDGSIYGYTYAITGEADVEEMKRLANMGDGLLAYINKYVRRRYAYRR